MVSGSLPYRSCPRVVEDRRAPLLMARPIFPVPPYTSRRPPVYMSTPDERLRTEIYISLPVPARLAPQRSASAWTTTGASTGRSESPFMAQARAWDTFFGRSSRSNSSRDKKPPKSEMEEGGSEPETMAKHLFWYGFVFPLFWLLGIFVLFSPLKSLEDAPSISIDSASTASITTTTPRRIHADELELVRAAERRWALRCCIAWVAFLVLLAGVFVILWSVGVFANCS